jgi:predicted XRE-type DNA-binding protein
MEVTRKNLLALVKTGLERNQLSITALERNAEVPKDTVRDFLRGKTQILRADKLQKILRILQPQQKVPVAGFVGEESRITFEPTGQYVDCPPGLEPYDVTAVSIKGDAMSPVFLGGWVVYYSNTSDTGIPPLTGGWQVPYNAPGSNAAGHDFQPFIGKPCIVKTKSGSVLLRTVKQGSAPNRFHLVSYNCSDIEDAELDWAAKIIFIKTE